MLRFSLLALFFHLSVIGFCQSNGHDVQSPDVYAKQQIYARIMHNDGLDEPDWITLFDKKGYPVMEFAFSPKDSVLFYHKYAYDHEHELLQKSVHFDHLDFVRLISEKSPEGLMRYHELSPKGDTVGTITLFPEQNLRTLRRKNYEVDTLELDEKGQVVHHRTRLDLGAYDHEVDGKNHAQLLEERDRWYVNQYAQGQLVQIQDKDDPKRFQRSFSIDPRGLWMTYAEQAPTPQSFSYRYIQREDAVSYGQLERKYGKLVSLGNQ